MMGTRSHIPSDEELESFDTYMKGPPSMPGDRP